MVLGARGHAIELHGDRARRAHHEVHAAEVERGRVNATPGDAQRWETAHADGVELADQRRGQNEGARILHVTSDPSRCGPVVVDVELEVNLRGRRGGRRRPRELGGSVSADRHAGAGHRERRHSVAAKLEGLQICPRGAEPDVGPCLEAGMHHRAWIGVVISWVLGYIVAFYFDRMLALWVFLSTLLTSTVLVPILLGIFCSEWRKPLAGLMSAVTGLVSAILFYGIVEWFGTFSEENGTTILTIITESGIRYDIWQEYAMLFTLPLSLTGFFVGLFLDRGSEKL